MSQIETWPWLSMLLSMLSSSATYSFVPTMVVSEAGLKIPFPWVLFVNGIIMVAAAAASSAGDVVD